MHQQRGIDVRFVRPLSSSMKSYLSGWLITGVILIIDTVWLGLTHYAVKPGSMTAASKGVLVLVGIAALLRGLGSIPRYNTITAKFRYVNVSDIAAWCAVLVCFVPAMCVLSYLCVTVDAPLVEKTLIRFDRAVGFDWLGTYRWVHAHPHVQRILALAYESGRWQLIALPLILGLSGRREALPDFFFLIALASVLLLVVSTPFPASSAFVYFNVNDPNTAATVSDFAALREGTLRVIDLANPQGLISMPSFHTALAVLFAYSLRRVRGLFGLAVALNAAMIVSTPTQGGHYLADVVGGVVLAAVTIRISKARFYRRRTDNVPGIPTIGRSVL